jgi:hypothetical protein
MADYSKSTNFTAKDTLPTGNAGKIVKGSEIDNELTAVSNAIASKADINSPNLTGTPTAPTASSGTSTAQIATTAFVTAALSAAYPIGSIYINATSSSNPTALLGFGTWVAFGEGRMLVGFQSTDTLFDTLEETGGSKNAVVVSHNHTASSAVSDPGHNHNAGGGTVYGGRDIFGAGGGSTSTPFTPTAIGNAATGITVSTSIASSGVSGTNANLPPYITVRMWKRTA